MDGQSLPFTSFTVHNFYFIQLQIIFQTVRRNVLLHTSFGTGGGFVPGFITKQILENITTLPTYPIHHSCSNVVFRAASFPSVL